MHYQYRFLSLSWEITTQIIPPVGLGKNECVAVITLDVECTSKGDVDLLQWVSSGIPIVVWNMRRQQNKGQSYRHSWILQEGDEQQDEENGYIKKNCCLKSCLKRRGKKEKAPKPQSPLAQRLSRTPASSIQRTKEISYRPIAYMFVFFATYFCGLLYSLLVLYGDRRKIPFALIYMARFTYPLQSEKNNHFFVSTVFILHVEYIDWHSTIFVK